MSKKPCPREDEVAAAAREGLWSPELSAHRDSCLSCAELTLVTAALAADFEGVSESNSPLPDPGAIWLRARLTTREKDFRRATRWISLVQIATLASAAAVALVFAPGIWRLFAELFSGVNFSPPVNALPRAAGSPTLVLVASMTVLGVLAVFEFVNQPTRRSG